MNYNDMTKEQLISEIVHLQTQIISREKKTDPNSWKKQIRRIFGVENIPYTDSKNILNKLELGGFPVPGKDKLSSVRRALDDLSSFGIIIKYFSDTFGSDMELTVQQREEIMAVCNKKNGLKKAHEKAGEKAESDSIEIVSKEESENVRQLSLASMASRLEETGFVVEGEVQRDVQKQLGKKIPIGIIGSHMLQYYKEHSLTRYRHQDGVSGKCIAYGPTPPTSHPPYGWHQTV